MNSEIVSSRLVPAQRQGGTGRPTRLAAQNRYTENQICGRLLHGNLNEHGVSIESYDFELAGAVDWSRSFHPNSLELCLNLEGDGSVRQREDVLQFGGRTAAFFQPGKAALEGNRAPNQRHRFITIGFSPRFLREHLSKFDGALHPLVERLVQGRSRRAGLGEIQNLTTEQESMAVRLLEPHAIQAARPLWYQGKILELMAEFFFAPQGESELFCDRQKRVARERVARVVSILRGRLAEPPSLLEIGREIGCSPFHLSRTFSQEMRMTIPQYLRKLRMERAAELLRDGRHNVTEAALEVGYSSLSHFSLAFCQTMGCCPGLYPLK
jgi:AraC family transcriptional regulator